jgi:cytidylate kinase
MNVIVIMGLPCSGKTTVCRDLKDKDNINYYSTGDTVREMCSEEYGEDYDSSELGDFSTRKRKKDEAYATKDTLKKVKDKDKDQDAVIFEGVRSKEELDYLETEVENLVTIFIDVSFGERARRLINRGRNGENSKEVMKERDKREKSWGMKDVIQNKYYDIKVNGNCSQEELYKKVKKEINSLI